MRIVRLFEEPFLIVLSWTIFIVGIIGAAKIIGAKLPEDGLLAGPGDLLRNA